MYSGLSVVGMMAPTVQVVLDTSLSWEATAQKLLKPSTHPSPGPKRVPIPSKLHICRFELAHGNLLQVEPLADIDG